MMHNVTPGSPANAAPDRGEAPSSTALVVIGFVVSGGILLLALTFGWTLLAAWDPLPEWLDTTAAMTFSMVLFAVMVPPPVVAMRPALIMALAFAQAALVAIGGILLRQRLGLATHGASNWTVFLLAIPAGYVAAKALARAGVTERLRRIQ